MPRKRLLNEIRERRAEARRKEGPSFTMRAVRERERDFGQVCIYCGQRKPITAFDIRNICRLCETEAKEAPRGKSRRPD